MSIPGPSPAGKTPARTHDPTVCGLVPPCPANPCPGCDTSLGPAVAAANGDVRYSAAKSLSAGPGGEGNPRGVRAPEPFRPFPVNALPAPIAEYVRQGAQALGCDPAYLALPALAVAAGMIGYTRRLRLKRTWQVPSVLWTLVVADSGSLKTPAFRHATDHLFTMQKCFDLEFKRKLAGYVKAKEEWKAAASAAKHGEGDPPGDEPELPVRRTVFTSDATIEAIAELLDENPRGLLVSCDELAGWLGSFSRYKGKAGGTDLQRWLSMHSAGGFAYHRKTGERRRIVVPHAAVSVAGGIQPGILAGVIAGEFIEAGLAGRLLMAMPPRPAKVWSEMEIDPDTEQRYHGLLESLYALESDRRDGEVVPHVLRLSPEAKAGWVKWYNGWGKEQAAVEGELAAAFSKIEEAMARFALVHHVVSCVNEGQNDITPVRSDSIEAGVALAVWFAAEARRVYAILAESDEQRDRRRLVEFIRDRGGRITVRELQRANGRKYPDAAAATAALEGLVQDGLGRWVDGLRSRALELCPTPDTSDSCSADDALADGPVSDTSPDSCTSTPDSPAQNGQVSDVSDCRTGIQPSQVTAGEATATVGPGGQVSDGEREQWEERAAIMEYDGRLAREQAEGAAWVEFRERKR